MRSHDNDGVKAKSDEELMVIYQAGSTAAFDVLFQRHSSRIFGYLRKRLAKKKEAEDLLQEVFLKLHRSKHLYNATLPFPPWLFSITRSVLLDSAKKKNLELLVGAEAFAEIPSGTETSEEQNDLGLSDVLQSLPLAQRQAVQFRVYQEETFEEIAVRLSTSPENARQLFSRGLKKIRAILSGKEK
jgi:RNA polymerase sigma-70 factor (ECF subfamily)